MNATTAFTALLVLPFVASPVIYLAGRLITRSRGESEAPNPIWVLAFLTLVATAVPLYYAGQTVLAGNSITLQEGVITLRMDGIGLLLAAIVLVIGIMVTLFSVRYVAAEAGEEKFYALLVALTGAMIGLGNAGDLFNLWVWFEGMAIISFLLVAFYRQQLGSLEAGFKYMVQSALGSTLVLLGISLVFMQTGQLDFGAIQAGVRHGAPLLLAAGALFVTGFGVKAALVPLHTWLPDAHSQAPSGISAVLSGVLIEAGLVALLRVLGVVSAASAAWGPLLLGFGALNMLVGNLMALRQVQVKRLLAYSSISHVGYMLLGLGIAISFGQPNGAAGGFFHLITHALMKGLAFLAAGALLYALYLARGEHKPLLVEDLDGTARRYPWVALALSVAVLGLAGLPPMAGFMSKWQILAAGVQTNNTIILLLVIFAALNSILSLGYYAPLVNRMYRKAPSAVVAAGKPIGATMTVPLLLLMAAVVILGFWPSLVSSLTNGAAAALLAAFGH